MIQNRAIFPELSHIDECEGSGELTSVFVTAAGACGTLFEIPGIDLEGKEASHLYQRFSNLARVLEDGQLLRLHLSSSYSTQLSSDAFRAHAVRELGYTQRELFLSIEAKTVDPFGFTSLFRSIRGGEASLSSRTAEFARSLPWSDLKGVGARVVSAKQLLTHFQPPCSSLQVQKRSIDFGTKVLGVIRLFRQGSDLIHQETLGGCIKDLKPPFRIQTSLKKVSRTQAHFRLNSLIKGRWPVQDTTGAEKSDQAETILKGTLLQGSSLLGMEWLLMLERDSEEVLRRDLEEALSVLSPLGELMVETFGCVNSLLSSRLGSSQHFAFHETSDVAPYFLPIGFFGEAISENAEHSVTPRTLIAHRTDGSLALFDLFDERFLAYNMLISGKAGGGKSVFGNVLSSSLLQDPNIVMTKMDVGGSYEKECEIYGGSSVTFDLSQPSGMNPFVHLKALGELKETVSTFSEFLCCLIREQDEESISKLMRAQVEELFTEYLKRVCSSPGSASIESLALSCPTFPRMQLLKRWAKGGVFENALKTKGSSQTRQESKQSELRYQYYNFKNIQGASSPDYANGIMAAVIAQVNLKMLLMSQNRNSEQRFVFFCDETKFFLERHAEFFLLTTANFRKFGHSVILMAQNVRDFEINRSGQVDRGIILNSPNRVFFETHLPESYLREEFSLRDHEIDTILKSPFRGHQYRSAVLQDDTGSRVIHLNLTAEEFWRVSSKREHQIKYRKLRDLIPELTAGEVVRILALDGVTA